MAKKGRMDDIIAVCFESPEALRQAVAEHSGFVLELGHFDLRVIDETGRQLHYRLSPAAEGIRVVERLYEN